MGKAIPDRSNYAHWLILAASSNFNPSSVNFRVHDILVIIQIVMMLRGALQFQRKTGVPRPTRVLGTPNYYDLALWCELPLDKSPKTNIISLEN
jgi:hypothetical protein